MSQLPVDCLIEIFQYLEEDKFTMYSCLLVNRIWCQASVRIFWKKIRNYDTIIGCLPLELKEKNGLSTKYPTFNYVSFCKMISIYEINYNIRLLLRKKISTQKIYKVLQEIYKLLMSQISSLKELKLSVDSFNQNVNFISYPRAKNCLKDLSELYYDSDVNPNLIYQLSRICHNILSIKIIIQRKNMTNELDELANLIAVQKNLNCLQIYLWHCNIEDNNDKLSFIPNNFDQLIIHGSIYFIPLAFIGNLRNLKEMILSFRNSDSFDDFYIFRSVNFPFLRSLKFTYKCPRNEFLIKFLENNGQNLIEFYVHEGNNLLNLAIVKFCPNLIRLSTGFKNNELETLKIIFIHLHNLETIRVWCCEEYPKEVDIFKIVVNYSNEHFHELKLTYSYYVRTPSTLLPEEVENFFIEWSNRTPRKALSLMVYENDGYDLTQNDRIRDIIEKYIKLGVVEKFKIIGHY
ncbi:hypothetical protein C1645_827826 [Glomus cerebriforme]|uniref:F-box domain-containing protein n=1 Tax=Glomus cerebriforme TaxID=658196 RepID=A0A397STS0_9GLOM|nr:hypothetical protein C1645_827826 [Glomus cerebriforme]